MNTPRMVPLDPDVETPQDEPLEPSELDIETQIESDEPLPPIALLAQQLSDGDLLQVADFNDDGSARNVAARELYRRWRERARQGWPVLEAMPAIVGGRLVFQPQQETTPRRHV